jgi:hypothetical protein
MKNYKTYFSILLVLILTACTQTDNEHRANAPFPTGSEVPNCAADGPGCKQFNPDKDSIIPCTREYAPVCAEVQVQCVTTPCEAVKKTFPNICVMRNNKQATFLYKGVCK